MVRYMHKRLLPFMMTLVALNMFIIFKYLHQTSSGSLKTNIDGPMGTLRTDSQRRGVHLQYDHCQTLSGLSRLTICPGDVIPEEIALSFPPCVDEKLAADAGKSVISLPGGRSRFKQGDMISILITLHDGYGRPKRVGGDHLRARIVGDNSTSAVTGTVFDHDNGSYTAQFEALFSGEITVDVVLAYTREAITTHYRIRTKLMATTNMAAQFVNKFTKETTICHTIPDWLSNYTELCNFTMDTSGMPWYCGKPVHRNLLCEDWVFAKLDEPLPVLPITSVEDNILTRGMRSIPNNITATVDTMPPNALATMISMVPCTEYNRTDLWYKREPTGYFNKERWLLRHCQAKSLPDFKTCVQNKRLILFGDSTTRQWIDDLKWRFECNIVSERWTKDKWHRRAKCVNYDLNFTTEWILHSQPLFFGSEWDYARYSKLSISRYIDEGIKDEDRVIVLLHLFSHVIAYRHDVFQTKIRVIRKSVERLLARNKFVTILIKAPHTYRDTPIGSVRWPDYFGYLYRNIMFHEFAGLHERVVYLDHKDITNALQVVPNHPPGTIVAAMVDQMFSYIC